MNRRPRGFSMISSIFVLVILSVIGSLLLSLSATQATTFAQQVNGARTYYAAMSAMEWASYRIAVGGTCPVGTTTFALSGGAISNQTASVNCSAMVHATPTGTETIYDVLASSQTGIFGQSDFAYRQMQGTVRTP